MAIVAAFFLAVLAGAAHSAAQPQSPRFDKIDIVGGAPGNGYLDLSVAYGDDGIGWLTGAGSADPGGRL